VEGQGVGWRWRKGAAPQGGRVPAPLGVAGDLPCPTRGERRVRGEERQHRRAPKAVGDVPTSPGDAGCCDSGNKWPFRGPLQ